MTFHLLVRAVIVEDHHLLLAHFHGAGHTFLPGGHVEHGESIPATLRRELMEELQVYADVGTYLGAIEHAWAEGDTRHVEVNHFFEVASALLSQEVPPPSYVANLEFYWVPVDRLREHNLQPPSLWTFVPRWLQGDRSPWWATILDNPGDAV